MNSIWKVGSTYLVSVISVVLSAFFSWLFSFLYFRKSNRNALQIDIIIPLVKLIDTKLYSQNRMLIKQIQESYSLRFCTKKERKAILSLLEDLAYLSEHDEISVDAESFVSYFKYQLSKNNIQPESIPEYYDNQVVFYSLPEGFNDIYLEIGEIINSSIIRDESYDDCIVQLRKVFHRYANSLYGVNISFFEDYCPSQIVKVSKVGVQYSDYLHRYEKDKHCFIKLPIVKYNN